MKEERFLVSFQDEIQIRKLIREYINEQIISEYTGISLRNPQNFSNIPLTATTIPGLIMSALRAAFTLPGMVFLSTAGLIFVPTETKFVLGSGFYYAKALAKTLAHIPEAIDMGPVAGLIEIKKKAKEEWKKARLERQSLDPGSLEDLPAKIRTIIDSVTLIIDSALSERLNPQGFQDANPKLENTKKLIKIILTQENDPELYNSSIVVTKDADSESYQLTDNNKPKGEIDIHIENLYRDGQEKEAFEISRDLQKVIYGPMGERIRSQFLSAAEEVQPTKTEFVEEVVKKFKEKIASTNS